MRAASSAAWLVAGRIAADGLSFALFVLIARAFGPDGIGVYAFNFAIATLLYELITFGIEEYGVREHVRRPAAARGGLIAALLGSQLSVMTAGLLILAALIAAGALERAHAPLLVFMIAYQIGNALAQTLFVAPFAAGRVHLQVASEVASRAGIVLLAATLLAVGEPDLTSTLVGFPVFGALLAVVAALIAHRLGSSVMPRFSWDTTLEMLRALWSFAAASLLLAVFARTGVVLLFLLAGSAAAGVFASAFKFAEVGWIVLAMLPWAAYARLTELHGTALEAFRTFSSHVLGATLVLATLIAWGMFWILPLAVPLLFGAEFEGAEPLLRTLAVLVLLLGADAHLSRLMLVADLQLARFWIAAVQAALAASLCAATIPTFGVQGAAAAVIGAQLAAVALELAALRAQAHYLAPILGRLSAMVAAAAAAGALPLAYGAPAWAAAAASLAALLAAGRLAGLLPVARWVSELRQPA